MKLSKKVPLIILLLSLISCESPAYIEDDFRAQYVVNVYLIAGEPLPSVTVHKTSPADEKFNWQENNVNNAHVQIRLLNANGSVAESYHYAHRKNGTYVSNDFEIIQPKEQYQLWVTFESGDTLEAKTTVPGDFEVANSPDSSYVYQQENRLELVSTPSSYPGRPAYYLFTVEANNRKTDNLTPFYKDLIREKGLWINSYYINSSDITGANNYNTNSEGNLLLNVPWSVFAFYGENKVTVNAIDNNLYETWPAIAPGLLTEGLSLSPGEMKKVPSHINGGLGIFGSLSRVSKTVAIIKKDK